MTAAIKRETKAIMTLLSILKTVDIFTPIYYNIVKYIYTKYYSMLL